MKLPACLRTASALALVASVLMLAGCGGGGGNDDGQATEEALAEQKTWLAAYMDDAYYWYALNPSPSPAGYTSIERWFEALLYTGGTAPFPADRWSYAQPAAAFEQFFSAGQTLGYGLAVAGMEVAGLPGQPLRVRYIEPASPAAGQIERGETVLSVNGVSSSTLIASGDFGVLTPARAGDTLTLEVLGATGPRTLSLRAAVYALTPLPIATALATPLGRPVGYLFLKDFISQARAPMDAAFADFAAAGAQEVVIDLRYNGGGLISVAGELASAVAPASAPGQPFAALIFNDRHTAENNVYRFGSQAAALGLGRVYVLSGPRTCSASELVINGLKPFVTVVQIGGTSCGKPVGFQPVSHAGTTFSAVNFETRNAAGNGRYWDGIAPDCVVTDDVDHALGDPREGLLAAALGHVDGGACPLAAGREQPLALRQRALRVTEPGEARGMIAR